MQLRRIAVPLVVSLACSGIGCKSKDPTGQGAPSASAATVTSSTLPAVSGSAGHKSPVRVPWAAIPSATAALLPNMGINERFEIEARSRPSGIKPNVEEVLGALDAAGVKLLEKKQHLGSPFGARYCVGARVVNAAGDATLFHLSVCEFVSEDVAKMSREYSEQSLASTIPDRSVYLNKQTTLTMREMTKSPDNDALGAKIIDTYKKLEH